MQPLNLVLSVLDPQTSTQIANRLREQFHSVSVNHDKKNIRLLLLRQEADVVILDLEFHSLDELHQLSMEFPRTAFVCTHRLADEEIWMKSLRAGAHDCCYAGDADGITLSVLRVARKTGAAAA